MEALNNTRDQLDLADIYRNVSPNHWIIFSGLFSGVSGIEISKALEPVPLTSGVSEIAACHLSPITDDPSAVPSLTSPPSSSSLEASPCMPAVVLATVLFKVLYCEIKNIFFKKTNKQKKKKKERNVLPNSSSQVRMEYSLGYMTGKAATNKS